MLRYSGFLLLLLLAGRPALGQQLYRVQEFSPKYYGRVWLTKPSEVVSPGWVAVYERKTGRQLVKVSSKELVAYLTKGRIKANEHQLPYGRQSVLQYEDFNFDGIKDLAIEEGHLSCYSGPSFRVYLGRRGGFTFSPAFTKLGQEYCGMFEVDKRRKRLLTTRQSGGWYQAYEYAVRGNRPVLVRTIEDDGWHPPFYTVTTTRWHGQRKSVSTRYTLNLASQNIKPLLLFQLAGTGKRLVLLNDIGLLTYALLQAHGDTVALRYPTPQDAEKSLFWLKTTRTRTTLMFRNGATHYQVYEDLIQGRVGIRVVTSTRTIDLPGVMASRQGSLARLRRLGLDNIATQ